MPTLINTFTAAVDTAIERSGRPDRLQDCVSWARSTMRECQVRSNFELDLIEDVIPANLDPFIWTKPSILRQVRTVQYPGLFDPQGHEIYPPMILPGRKQRGEVYFWYPSGDSFIFVGHSGSASAATSINIAYMAFFTALKHYTSSETQPATFSIEDDAWSYDTTLYTTDDEKETARALVTNWMLSGWFDMIIEGTLAKLYKTTGDDRSVPTFALYKSLQKDLERGAGRLTMGHNI